MGFIGYCLPMALWSDIEVETRETGALLLSSLVPDRKSMPLLQQLFGCCRVQAGVSEGLRDLSRFISLLGSIEGHFKVCAIFCAHYASVTAFCGPLLDFDQDTEDRFFFWPISYYLVIFSALNFRFESVVRKPTPFSIFLFLVNIF